MNATRLIDKTTASRNTEGNWVSISSHLSLERNCVSFKSEEELFTPRSPACERTPLQKKEGFVLILTDEERLYPSAVDLILKAKNHEQPPHNYSYPGSLHTMYIPYSNNLTAQQLVYNGYTTSKQYTLSIMYTWCQHTETV